MSDGVKCFLGSFATALQKWETVEEVERGCSAIRGVLHSTSAVGGGKLFSLDCTDGQPRLVETSYVSVDAEIGLHDEAACRLAAVGCRSDKQQYGLRASSSCQGQSLSCEELSGVSEVGEALSVVGLSDSRQDVPAGVVRGKHYESNRRKRLSRRNKKKEAPVRVCVDSVRDWRNPTGASSSSEPDQNVPTLREFVEKRADSEVFDQRCRDLEERLAEEAAVKSAKLTLNEKWAMENKLAAAKAKRALEVLEAQDLQAEIKKQSTYLKLQTEKNMVGMEKAHQFLKRTGNVPGFAQTVVSDGGLTDGSSASPVSPGECTISPDSSASMKEFRELAKRCADLEAKLDQFHKMTKIHPDYIELYKKQTWTINSENIRILDEMYPQGHALNPIPDYENYDAPTHGELIVGRDEEYFPY